MFKFQYNLIPRAVQSLKVLTELPIIVVLMLQLYKEQVNSDVCDFIPLIMNTIVLQPHQAQRLVDLKLSVSASIDNNKIIEICSPKNQK